MVFPPLSFSLIAPTVKCQPPPFTLSCISRQRKSIRPAVPRRSRSAAAQNPRGDGDRRRYGASPDSADAAPAATASATQGPAAEGAGRERNPPEGDRRPHQGPPARHECPSGRRVRPPRLRVCQVSLRTASCDSELPRVPAAPARPIPFEPPCG